MTSWRFPFVTGQGGVERLGIVVLEALGPGAREHGTVTQTEVRTIVHHSHVALAQEPGDCSQRSAETAVEEHRILVTEELRHPLFQLPMKIGHAREHG